MAETAAQKRQRKLDELEGFPPPPQSAARQASKAAFLAKQNAAQQAEVTARLGLAEGFGVARDPNDPAAQDSVGQRPVQVDGSLAANAQFPANDVAGLTTPPPQSQADLAARFQERSGPVPPPPPPGLGLVTRGAGLEDAGRTAIAGFDDLGGALFSEDRSAHGVGSALGDIAKGGAGVAVNAPFRAARTAVDLTKAALGGVINAGAGFLGFDAPPTSSAALADEPTGTLPVDTQGEIPGPAGSPFRADFDRAINSESGIDIVAGTQPAPDIDNLLANDGTGAQSLKAPPIPATMGLDPIEVIRGTERTNFFPKTGRDVMGDVTRSTDLRRGLEVPEGFDEATGARVGRLMGGGMSFDEAIASMDAQDQTAASAVAAGASVLRAHADAANNHTDAEGNLWITQIGPDGTILMTNTGVSVLEEAKVGTMRDPLGNVSSYLLYPSMIDRLGKQQYGAVPLDELGVDPDDEEQVRRVEERWRELILKFPSHEVIDAIIAEGV